MSYQDRRPDETERPYEHDAPLRDLRPTLMIADDDAVMRSVLGSQLSDSFRIVGVGKDATEAIALAEQHRPDVALLDVEMPGGGARVAVVEINTRSPATCMVILSGDESHQIVLELLNAGAIAYIRKGIGADQLSKMLADALAVKSGLPARATA